MRKRLILAGLTLTVIVAGVAALSAFTAQVVNITAHAEKDIAVEPIICGSNSNFGANYDEPCYVDPNGGGFGVTLPQALYDKEIEVTLSNSFFDQDVFFDLEYDVFWECKQFKDERDHVNNLTGVAPPDTFPDCRDNYLVPGAHDICKNDLDGDGRADILEHCNAEVLDDNIRGHIFISAKADPIRCQTDEFGEPTKKASWDDKQIEWQFSGILNKATPKCRYALKFLSPPCIGSFNEFTDPVSKLPTPVPCHKADKARHVNFDDDGDQAEGGGFIGSDATGTFECTDGIDNDGDGFIDNLDPECTGGAFVDEDPCDAIIDNDFGGLDCEDAGAESINPQDIDEWADLGDDFKIQVFFHSLTPSP